MAENTIPLEAIRYRRVFPWLHLFRAFWIAVDIRKMLLAGFALIAIAAGGWVFDQLPFSPMQLNPRDSANANVQRWPWQESLDYDLWHGGDALSELRGGLSDPWNTLQRISRNWQLVLRPLKVMLEPAEALFRANATWSQLAYGLSRLVWALCVWTIFGGAIGRMAAVEFARDQRIGVGTALKFSLWRFLDYFSAPMLPLIAVAAVWGLCAAGGALGRIPVAGEIIVGVLWGVGLMFGFLMALILIGLAAGWPLMFATVSVEATDGFDGLSRAYNYVFERPWLYFWYALVTMVYGSLVIFCVWMMGELIVFLAGWALTWGMGYEAAARLFADAPRLMASAVPTTGATTTGSLTWGTHLVGGWLRLMAVLVVGFVHSYFWVSTTIMYFLLRRSVDANDLDEIHFDDEQQPDDLLPLVGTAAVNMAEAQKLHSPATETASAPPVDLAP